MESGKDSPNGQGQSGPIKKEIQVESPITNDKSQSSIQDSLAVETHALQGSEGQLRKPTELSGVDVIATPSHGHNTVNARSDDLLALQAERRLEHSTVGKSSAVSSLNSEPKIIVSRSEFTNCTLVRPEGPTATPRWKEIHREMEEIEQFLKKDFLFSSFTNELKGFKPERSRERDEWLEYFFRRIYIYIGVTISRLINVCSMRDVGR
jgi:hypothetical protein